MNQSQVLTLVFGAALFLLGLWWARKERTAPTRTSHEYRITLVRVPLAQDDYLPKPPAGDGWEPKTIGGTERVLYVLWKREAPARAARRATTITTEINGGKIKTTLE